MSASGYLNCIYMPVSHVKFWQALTPKVFTISMCIIKGTHANLVITCTTATCSHLALPGRALDLKTELSNAHEPIFTYRMYASYVYNYLGYG